MHCLLLVLLNGNVLRHGTPHSMLTAKLNAMAPGGHRVRVQRVPQRVLPARGGVLHMWHRLCSTEGQRCEAAAGCDLEWGSDTGHPAGRCARQGIMLATSSVWKSWHK